MSQYFKASPVALQYNACIHHRNTLNFENIEISNESQFNYTSKFGKLFKMAKLSVMEFDENLMAVLGIYQHPSASPLFNWLRLLFPYVVIISLILSDTFAIMYAYQEPVLSFKLEAIALLIGGTEALFGYINLKWKVRKVGQLNCRLQEIVDQGMSSEYSAKNTNCFNPILIHLLPFFSRS